MRQRSIISGLANRESSQMFDMLLKQLVPGLNFDSTLE